MTDGAAHAIARRIAEHGPIGFDEFVELALYDPAGGFFATGGGAGRTGGDFITSPEVGPLFGAVVARYLDAQWAALGRPDPFVVVEAGAGRGALAIAVLAALPECAPALRYVLVERSAELRARHGDHLTLAPPDALPPRRSVLQNSGKTLTSAEQNGGGGPLVCSVEALPDGPLTGVILANELLDNLPFRLLERSAAGWSEVRVGRADAGAGFEEVLADADGDAVSRAEQLAPGSGVGARVPLQDGARGWVEDALGRIARGSLLVIDYASTTADLAGRPMVDWLRTYRGHERGGDPLTAPGSQDVTCEVAIDQLDVGASVELADQAGWLRRWGIEELVDEGRRVWAERAAAPDLTAMRARSRVAESEALLDPEGLGGFAVFEWRVP